MKKFDLKYSPVENLKKYLKETEDFREIKIQSVIAIDNDSELLKSEIVSHIRAIEGVTRVDIR